MYKPPKIKKPDRVRCYFCGNELKIEKLGGMFNIGQELRCYCINIKCLTRFDDWVKGKEK